MDTTVEYITPQIAMEMLNLVGRQRKLKDKTVRSYARTMGMGGWKENGEAIIFDKNGCLVDGQHRLQAIVRSNTSHRMVVVREVEPDSINTIDIGKIRTMRDALGVGYGYERVDEIEIARKLWMYRNKYMVGGTLTPSPDEIKAIIDSEELIGDAAKMGRKVKAMIGFTRSWAGALWIIFKRLDSDAADLYFDYLVNGNGTINSSLILLRNRLVQEAISKAKTPVFYRVALCIKAWNSVRTGTSLKTLKYIDSEPFPTAI